MKCNEGSRGSRVQRYLNTGINSDMDNDLCFVFEKIQVIVTCSNKDVRTVFFFNYENNKSSRK